MQPLSFASADLICTTFSEITAAVVRGSWGILVAEIERYPAYPASGRGLCDSNWKQWVLEQRLELLLCLMITGPNLTARQDK